jgi:hypothetical protein
VNQLRAAAGKAPIDRPVLPPNPKQAFGDKKVPLGLMPSSGVLYGALGFVDGATKYGAYNWREKPVEAMTYVHAARRHLDLWVDGQELSDSEEWEVAPGVFVTLGQRPNLGHAISCLSILADSIENENLIDNRPPPLKRSRQTFESWKPAPTEE